MQKRLSAGRVQSVMLRLIVDRWRDNQAFEPESYYGAELDLGDFKAEWDYGSVLKDGAKYNFDRELAQQAAGVDRVEVIQVERKNRTRKPAAPFTTSAMQKAATKIGIPMAEAMKAAQELYEKAFITYHRTDSVELAPESIDMLRQFALSKGYPIPDKPNAFKSKVANAQEAHEAIRPTDFSVESVSGVSDSASKLYELIYKQALASQLAPAKLNDTKVTLISMCRKFEYTASGSVVVDPGFMVVTGKSEDRILPVIDDEQDVFFDVVEGRVLDKQTKAPALYTEASILGELEKLGIGRPATWASIMTNIRTRGYIGVTKSKSLAPTQVGLELRDSLSGFGFMEYEFTAESEDQMDLVSNGELSYKACIDRVFRQVFADVRDKLEFEGGAEDFFLPPDQRDYKPSDKQIAAVNKMANALGLSVDQVDLSSGRAVSEFLSANADAYKASFPPTDNQLKYAELLATELNIEIAPEIRKSMVKLSAFIDKYRPEVLKLRQPSDKQKELAIKLAEQNGVQLPPDCLQSMSVCSDFIGKYMKKGGKSKRKTVSKKRKTA